MWSLGRTGVGRHSSWSITHSFPRLPVLDDLLNNSNYPTTDRQTDRWDAALGVCRRLNERNAWGTRRNERWLREQSSDSRGKHWLTLDKSLSVRISATPLAKSSSHVVLHPVCIPQRCPVPVSGASPSAINCQLVQRSYKIHSWSRSQAPRCLPAEFYSWWRQLGGAVINDFKLYDILY